MPYDIATSQEYIRIYYWGNGDTGSPHSHTNQLTTISKLYKKYKFLIDTRDLDSVVEPLDYEQLARYVLDNNIRDISKIAILCRDSYQRSVYSKFDLTSNGIECGVFYKNETARQWLMSPAN